MTYFHGVDTLYLILKTIFIFYQNNVITYDIMLFTAVSLRIRDIAASIHHHTSGKLI